MKRILISIAIILIVINCANRKTTVCINPQFYKSEPKVYAILSFEDKNTPANKENFPGAADIIRESFETAFLETNNLVVERTDLNRLAAEMKFSLSDLTIDQGIEIGKLLNADAIITGILYDYSRKMDLMDPFFVDINGEIQYIRSISFSVKVVDVETGLILWKANNSLSTKYYELPDLAEKLSGEIVYELLRKRELN